MAISEYSFLVDWDADGDFSEYLCDITAYVKSASWQIGMHEMFQLVGDETRLTLTLKNEDRRFSPENASSPYYGNLLPQRRVKIVATVDGVDTTMYLGFIDSIEPEALDGRTCVISCASPKQYMQDQVVRLPLLENVTTGYVVERIVEQMHLPASISENVWILGIEGSSELGETTYLADLDLAIDIDTGLTTLPYVGDNWGDSRNGYATTYDWVTDFRGYDAIRDLCEAERGRFFFSRDGVATFWSRDHLITTLTAEYALDGSDLYALDYRYGDRVYNDVRVMAYPRSITAGNEVLWSLDEEIEVRPQQHSEETPRTMKARYTDSSDSEAKIGGLDAFVSLFTADAGVESRVVYDARGAEITLMNTTTTEKMVTAMEISGRKVTSANRLELTQIDGLSITNYGKRELRIDCKLIAETGFAQRVAEYECARWSNPQGLIYSVSMLVNEAAEERAVINCEMGSRISVADTQTGHDAEYFIIGEQHEWTLGAGHQVTWYLELADMRTYWVLGTAGLSELGETTYLGL